MDTVDRIIRCPRCGRRSTWQNNEHRPFCSEKCQQVDLGRWASEDYAIAGKPVPPADDEPSEF